MLETNFIDYVKVFCRSGKGGKGSSHFHRAKGMPKGGPDGGDGGKGGDIILRGNAQLWTLLHLKYRKHIHAEDGKPGASSLCTGASGKSQILEVPLGTLAKDEQTGKVLFEITKDGEERILLKGGRGGQGNNHYKTSTNQAPTYAQPGEDCVEGWKILELKVLADVGLVGFPNAGKSTLLSVMSAAKPKIANYPFTTLVPNLGIVEYRDYRSFVMADIPGIIEGAHEGKGLGHRFLKHIERNALLLFLIPSDSNDIKKELDILINELKEFNPELVEKERVVAITKCDFMDKELFELMKEDLKDVNPIFISAVSGLNIQALKDQLWDKIKHTNEAWQ
jgi:GTP-binding protein